MVNSLWIAHMANRPRPIKISQHESTVVCHQDIYIATIAVDHILLVKLAGDISDTGAEFPNGWEVACASFRIWPKHIKIDRIHNYHIPSANHRLTSAQSWCGIQR